MATGRKEMKTPMELAAKKGKAQALTVLGQYTQVNIFGIYFFLLVLKTLIGLAATKGAANAFGMILVLYLILIVKAMTVKALETY